MLAPRRLALLLPCLLPLPGCCATWALWTDEQPHPVVVADTTVDSEVRCALTTGDGLLLVPAAGGSTWRLAARDGADLAAALLLVGGGVELARVAVRVERETKDGTMRSPRAEVSIAVRVLPELAQTIAPAELPRRTQAALREAAERVDFPFTAAPPASSDPLLAECIARLRGRDFAPLLASRAAPVVVAMVAVDEDLQVGSRARGSAGAAPELRPLRELLPALAPDRILVELSDGRRRHLLVLRADAAWLWGALTAEGDHLVHRSTWDAFLAGDEPAPPLQWPATLQVRDIRVETQLLERSVWTRLALTPLTLVADLAGAWLLHELGIDWFCDDEDEDDRSEHGDSPMARDERWL